MLLQMLIMKEEDTEDTEEIEDTTDELVPLFL